MSVQMWVCAWRELSLTFLCQWLRRRAGSPPLSSCIVLAWLQTLPVQPCLGLERVHTHIDTNAHTHRITCSNIETTFAINSSSAQVGVCVYVFYSGHICSAECTYCQAWLPFRQSHTAWCRSLQLWGHSQWQSMTAVEKEEDERETKLWICQGSTHYIRPRHKLYPN